MASFLGLILGIFGCNKTDANQYFLTFGGILTTDSKEDDLGDNHLPLSPLFHKAHEVIAQARMVDEKMRSQQGQ